jgi:hypothetical protein
MDSKEIIEKLTKMRQDIDDILIELEPPKEYGEIGWYRNETYGWLIYRTGPSQGFGWNPNGKWVGSSGWDYAFYSDGWKKANPHEVVSKLVSEAIHRYDLGEFKSLDVTINKITLDNKVIFTTTNGEWIKNIDNES